MHRSVTDVAALLIERVRAEAKAEALRSQAEFFRQIDMDAAADHCEQTAIEWDSTADDKSKKPTDWLTPVEGLDVAIWEHLWENARVLSEGEPTQ